MGDRCYFSMTVLKEDRDRVSNIMFGEGCAKYPWPEEDDNGDGTITLAECEANYGYLDQRQELAKAGMVFHGYHGPGGEYSEGVFACFDSEHIEVAAIEATPVAFVNGDGKVEEWSLKAAQDYYRVLEQVQEHFKKTARHAQSDMHEAGSDKNWRCGMRQVLITISKGIIGQVMFFDDPGMAVQALSEYVKGMNVEHNDAAVYDSDGLIANAKHFLDDHDEYMENNPLIAEVAGERNKSIYIIGNPKHGLGFMVVSPDDPLGYNDPVAALSDLGQMRQDSGRHLKLYRVMPVENPVANRDDLDKYNADCEVEGFDYSMVQEYLG